MKSLVQIRPQGIKIPSINRRFGLLSCNIAFDNGVAKSVLGMDQSRVRIFRQHVAEINNFRTPYLTAFATPYMAAEAIGIGTNAISRIVENSRSSAGTIANWANLDEENCWVTLTQIFQDYREAISNSAEFQPVSLERRYLEQRGFMQGWIRDVYFDETLKKSLFDAVGRQQLVGYIANERLQALPFEKLSNAVFAQASAYFFSLLIQQEATPIEFSISRFVGKVHMRLKDKGGVHHFQETRDGLDTELTHFAVRGTRANNYRQKVCVFTTERLETWAARIAREISGLKYLTYLIRERGERLYVNPGYIVRVGSDGSVLPDYLCIEDHFDLDGLQFSPIK